MPFLLLVQQFVSLGIVIDGQRGDIIIVVLVQRGQYILCSQNVWRCLQILYTESCEKILMMLEDDKNSLFHLVELFISIQHRPIRDSVHQLCKMLVLLNRNRFFFFTSDKTFVDELNAISRYFDLSFTYTSIQIAAVY